MQSPIGSYDQFTISSQKDILDPYDFFDNIQANSLSISDTLNGKMTDQAWSQAIEVAFGSTEGRALTLSSPYDNFPIAQTIASDVSDVLDSGKSDSRWSRIIDTAFGIQSAKNT